MILMTKRKAGRPRKFSAPSQDDQAQPRSGKSVHVYLDPVLMDALNGFCESFPFPPKKTDVLERSLREFLQSQGHWPPKAKKESS